MNKLRRFYNQNSRGIWTLAIIIAFFLILLRLVNLWTAKKSTEELTNNQIKIENSVIKTENNINLESELSGITGEKKSSTIISTEVKIIQEFLNNCEKKDTEKAYDMLTEECKDEMYDTEEKFKEQYCNNNFKDDNMNFNIGCVVKYITRNGKKEGECPIKDLKKAIDYINFEIERLENVQK